jgi:hypothetical protein
MTYIDEYKARLNHFGEDNKSKIINSTKQSVNNIFSNNPSYRQVTINGESVDAIVNKTDKSFIKQILFRPDSIYDEGTLITIDSKQYLVIGFQENEVYPLVEAKLCNNILTVPLPPIPTIIGYDEMSNPIVEDEPVPPFTSPCIINGLDDTYQSNLSQSIAYTNADVSLTIQNSANLNATLSDKTFTMFANTYHIYGFQYDKTFDDDKGLLIVLAHNTASEAGGS